METKDNEYFRSAVTDEWNTLRPLTEQEQTEGKKQKSVRARQHKTARRAFSLAAPMAVVAVTATLVTTLSSLSCPVCGKTKCNYFYCNDFYGDISFQTPAQILYEEDVPIVQPESSDAADRLTYFDYTFKGVGAQDEHDYLEMDGLIAGISIRPLSNLLSENHIEYSSRDGTSVEDPESGARLVYEVNLKDGIPVLYAELVYLPQGGSPQEKEAYGEYNLEILFARQQDYTYAIMACEQPNLWLRAYSTVPGIPAEQVLEAMGKPQILPLPGSKVNVGNTLYMSLPVSQYSWSSEIQVTDYIFGYLYGEDGKPISKLPTYTLSRGPKITQYYFTYKDASAMPFYIKFAARDWNKVADAWNKLYRQAPGTGHKGWGMLVPMESMTVNGVTYDVYLDFIRRTVEGEYICWDVWFIPRQQPTCLISCVVQCPITTEPFSFSGRRLEEVAYSGQKYEEILALFYPVGTEPNPIQTQTPIPTQEPAVQTRRVPVLDTQYADILNDYHLVGSFQDGVAFAARYLPMTEEDYQQDIPLPRVECGYLTLEGEYTPLYTVPNELELIDPCADVSNLHGESYEIFVTTEEGLSIFYGHEPAYRSMPFLEQQIALDDTFTVGDNGWVPYYQDGKWGYCDLTGQVQLAPAYDFVSPFSGGKALVCQYSDRIYAWSIIDETGSEIAALEPEYRFALRKLEGDFIFCYGKSGVRIYNMEGQDISQGEVMMTSHYLEQDGYALARDRVYGPDGELYRAEDIQPVGVQDGCTVYADGNLYGIRGGDGEVRCPARFYEICQLAPEGFYAREGSNQVNLYDYDGNLLQEAVPCVRILVQNNGFALYDGQGNIMERYIARDNSLARYKMTGGSFITQDSFVYLYFSEQERITLQITFEEQPVDQAASQPAQSGSESFSQLQVSEGESFSIKRTDMPYHRLNNLSFLDWDFDSLSALDRCAVWKSDVCTGGLEWYETLDHKLLVCDDNFQTVFTVPQETVEWLHDPAVTASDPEGFYATPELFYGGDGLWTLQLKGRQGQGAVYVFDRQGNVLVNQELEKPEGAYSLSIPRAYANEGYWFFTDSDDRFYTMDGQTISIRFSEEEPVKSYVNVFDGGLANTTHGYVDTQGNVVISAQTLRENIEEYLQCQVDSYNILLRPFDGETAWIDVELDYGEEIYKKLEIDRTGKVLTHEDTPDIFCFDSESSERGDQIKGQMLLHMVDQPFYIVEQPGNTGQKLFTASGQQVTSPEGAYFGYSLVQWDDRFAFVELIFRNGEHCFIPVDANGRVYHEFSRKWDRIYASLDGKVYGVKAVKGDRGFADYYQVTPLEITLF